MVLQRERKTTRPTIKSLQEESRMWELMEEQRPRRSSSPGPRCRWRWRRPWTGRASRWDTRTPRTAPGGFRGPPPRSAAGLACGPSRRPAPAAARRAHRESAHTHESRLLFLWTNANVVGAAGGSGETRWTLKKSPCIDLHKCGRKNTGNQRMGVNISYCLWHVGRTLTRRHKRFNHIKAKCGCEGRGAILFLQLLHRVSILKRLNFVKIAFDSLMSNFQSKLK